MSESTPDAGRLASEVASFTRYLVGERPPPAVRDAYTAFHVSQVVGHAEADSAFDELLVSIARRGGLLTRLADVHASRFRRGRLLHRKLVLVIALLECVPPTFSLLDRPDAGGRIGFWFRIGLRGIREGVLLLTCVALLLPVQGLLALRSKARGGAAR